MPIGSILTANDNEDENFTLSIYLKKLGIKDIYVSSITRCIELIKKDMPAVLIFDISSPLYDSNKLLKEINGLNIVKYIIISADYHHIKDAVKYIELEEASQYITKPFSLKEINSIINLIESYSRIERYEKRIDSNILDSIVGNSKAVQDIKDFIRQVAPLDTNVLITGESGTGKELVAKAIHYLGPRAGYPFVTVNCASITETLLESELFGHVKGAFTGAISDRIGFFQEAHKGTLFLDEIGETSLVFQTKLLRAVEEKRIKKVGSNEDIYVDTKIISATNVDLKKKIADNDFRKDLFYRLAVVSINIPPLRDRLSDIYPLAKHFLALISKKLGKKAEDISKELLEKFNRYSWPGNIRELENIIEEAVILTTKDEIDISSLPTFKERLSKFPRKTRLTDISFAEAKKMFEIEYIIDLLNRANGNLSKASRIAKIDRKNLREKAKRYNIKKTSS